MNELDSELNRLEAFARYWQKELRLRDWDLIIKQHHYYDNPCFGVCSSNRYDKSAIISVVYANEIENRPFACHQEETIIHELLHLHLNWYPSTDKTMAEMLEEQAINIFAKALFRQRYKPLEEAHVSQT